MACGILIGSDIVDSKLFSRSTGLYRLATLFRNNGNYVEVIDFFNYWAEEELTTLYKKIIDSQNQIDFIGIGFSYVKLNFDLLIKFINKIKIDNPNCKIIAGGYGVLGNTSSFELLSETDPVDLYFKGFIEGAYDDLEKYIKTGKFNPFVIEKVKINEVEKNVVNCNKHYLVYNLSRLATNYDKRDNIKSNEALVLETCRGCMFKCKFCTYELIGKKKTDNYIREKEDLKQEIINNYNLWGTHKYIISDDTFNENPNKIDILYEISQEIDFKVNYWCLARVDLIKRFPESINKMISAGITSYFFGVETFNERSASCIGKGFSGDKLKNYLLDLKQKYPDIDMGAGLIVGLPYESLSDFEKNLDWCYSNKIFNSITLNSLFIPREGNLTETSIFSSDYKKYGYSEMSLEEIKNVHENDIIENLTNKPINWADTENYLKKYLPWKNEHLNFIESSKYVESITEKVRSSNSNESGLFCFLNSFNNQGVVYEHKFSIRNMLQIHRFVSQYIKHKISI
jgi:radical SAM superfamily enzyme YgiQ (UPF0313 family)